MHMSVDGACRGNGYPGTTASAAVIIHKRSGRTRSESYCLPSDPPPTSQRAELSAIIFALRLALNQQNNLDSRPFMDVEIDTDSKYAHRCMTEWRYKWEKNGFVNAAGREVANRDLIEKALDLEAEVEENGKVRYGWVPREENSMADEVANQALDEAEGSEDECAFSDYD
ncbi:MAG: hypothetical protein Q9209_003648 [Squamulea sp. 1 TL-2023]